MSWQSIAFAAAIVAPFVMSAKGFPDVLASDLGLSNQLESWVVEQADALVER